MWSYENLISLFQSQGESYVSEQHVDHHERHTFSGEEGVGVICIPHYGSGEPFGWTFSNQTFQEVSDFNLTPQWFQTLVNQSKMIMDVA